MKYNIAKIPIKPYSRFHFGKMKMDDNLALSDTSYFAHSDTLFSGIVNNASRIEGKGQDIVDLFDKGEMCISSLFYYIKSKNETVYLLPKPNFLNCQIEKEVDGSHKKLAKIKFVSKKVWDAGLQIKKWLDPSEYIIVQRDIVLTIEEYRVMGFKENTKIFQINSTPKSPKHAGPSSSIFYQSDLVINDVKGCEIGLYFLYQCDEKIKNTFANAVNLLALSGIGGEINIQGRTIPEIKSPLVDASVLEFDVKSDYYSNLSLFNPNSQTDLDKVIYRETLLRGGRRYEHLHKSNAQVVRMISEGGLFKTKNVMGRLVPIGIDMHGNKMMRNGIPLLIPIEFI